MAFNIFLFCLLFTRNNVEDMRKKYNVLKLLSKMLYLKKHIGKETIKKYF